MSIEYKIIATGSKGNAVLINNSILLDCGVPFKMLQPYYKSLRLVLLTHEHSDHFNKATVKRLATERPTLRFSCGEYLVIALIECGVQKKNIDILNYGEGYCYGSFSVEPVELTHNVKNRGYRLLLSNGKMFYATDTNTLQGITATNYDLYMIEANFEDAEILQKISKKEYSGQYAYEMQAMQNHLSKAKADEWILENMGENSKYVYLHEHIERGLKDV